MLICRAHPACVRERVCISQTSEDLFKIAKRWGISDGSRASLALASGPGRCDVCLFGCRELRMWRASYGGPEAERADREAMVDFNNGR